MAETETETRSMREEAEAWSSPYEEWKASEGIPTLRGL